jgi:hypothetical protein
VGFCNPTFGVYDWDMHSSLFPIPDMWDLARDGVRPPGDRGPAGPYGPNSGAVESLIKRVATASIQDCRRVARLVEIQCGSGQVIAWRDVHLQELESAAHGSGLDDAVRRAWFDALSAAVRACEDRMNAEVFFLHYWNLATESTFTESAGLAAVATALGDALSISTRERLLLPWTAQG